MGNSSGHHFGLPEERDPDETREEKQARWEASGGWLGALNRGISAIPVVGHVKSLVHLVVGDVDGAAGSFETANYVTFHAAAAYASNDYDPIDVRGHIDRHYD